MLLTPSAVSVQAPVWRMQIFSIFDTMLQQIITVLLVLHLLLYLSFTKSLYLQSNAAVLLCHGGRKLL